jgi:hypothetical protein
MYMSFIKLRILIVVAFLNIITVTNKAGMKMICYHGNEDQSGKQDAPSHSLKTR